MMLICPECFTRSVFQRRVKEIRAKTTTSAKCPRHPTRKGVDVGLIGPVVDAVFRANYGIGEFMFEEQEGSELTEVIADITGADDWNVAADIAEWLVNHDGYWPPDGETPFYGMDQCYVRTEQGGWQQSALWSRFRADVLHRQRFFNEEARNLLDQIFDGVQFQIDARGREAFYELTPDTGPTVYRARIATSEAELKKIMADPATELAPPPPNLRRSGRMNAAGIGVFYGAFDVKTAVAELRPPVGANVCVGRFRFCRPIRVLDLTRFSGPGKSIDIFSLNHQKRTSQWAFMLTFARQISGPVLPSDEHLEYVPAQIVAEYLSSTPRVWKGKEVTVDAICFASAQRPSGRNIAVLGDAARVVQPSRRTKPSMHPHHASENFFDLDIHPSPREPSLAYAEATIEHLEIRSAEFKHAKAIGSQGVADAGVPDF